MYRYILISLMLLSVNITWAENLKVKIGSSPVLTSAGIYLAHEKGYFLQEGIESDLTVFNNSGAPMTLLLSKGELDVGAGNLTAGLYNAVNEGQNFKIVADKGHIGDKTESVVLILRKDLVESGKYKSLKDLKGLKIALASIDGSSQQVVLDKILKKAGLISKDIEYVKLSYPEANVALKTKAIDGAIQMDPFLTIAIKAGYATQIIASNEVLPNQQSGALFYSPKFIESHPKEAVGFLKAYLRGVRLYNAALQDKELMKDVTLSLKKYIKIDDESIWSQLRPVGLRSDGAIDKDSILQDLKWYQDNGFLKKIPAESSYLDTSLIKKAVTELDKQKNSLYDK